MSSRLLACTRCNKKFKNRRALTQHHRKSTVCKTHKTPVISFNLESNDAPPGTDLLGFTRVTLAKRRSRMAKGDTSKATLPNLDLQTYLTFMEEQEDKAADLDSFPPNNGDLEEDFDHPMIDDDTENEAALPFVQSQPGGVSNLTDGDWIRNDWISYEQRALNFAPFTVMQLQAIRLLAILRDSNASLGTYDRIMNWHFRANGTVHMHENATSRHYLSREKLFSFLKARYNRDAGYGIVNEIILPSQRSRVRMVTNDTGKVIQSLLTRPENKGKDYIFYDHNPFARPPKSLDYISDANTGKCFGDTHDELIADPLTQVLCSFNFAADGTHLGQFSSFELTRFQIALGFLSREARGKEQNWGTLGWIPNIPKDKSQGRRSFVDSGHADATRFRAQITHDEGLIGVAGAPVHKAQDLHAMISYVLKGFKELQKTGFKWDLMYNGKLYKDVTMIPFVSFLRVDTKEADLFCGKYLNRNIHVAHLCRECHCPTDQSDNHLANYKAKTQHEIANLVRRKDYQGLKNISQQYIVNAYYDIQFGFHNEMGIHGACPMEMLHALYLGILKYTRDIFFEHVGNESVIAREIDALAMLYGELYCRQSDREWPNTRFPSGIRAGKQNGKKYTGILLCLLTAISSNKGRKLLEKRPKWRELGVIEDWIMLLETLLEWEAWLNSPKMMKADVLKAKTKHKYIMYLIRKVAARTSGMGLKLMKFHGILHMADSILNFGVPLEFDTGCNESHHIPTKKASQLTQRDLNKVEEQTAERMLEMEVLALAKLEISGKWLCDYRLGHADDIEVVELPHKTRCHLGGAAYVTEKNGQTGQISMRAHRVENGKKKYPMVEGDLLFFIDGLQVRVSKYIGAILLYSCYTRAGHIFRGDLSYRKHVWRDWVIIDWGKDGQLPNRIYGFVDLRALPDILAGPNRISYGGVLNIKPAIYAIVEATTLGCDGVNGSELFDVLETEVSEFDDGMVTKLKFYLADVDSFMEPCVVVPNVGGPTNSYFWAEPRSRWSELFVKWLRAPHSYDETEDLTALEQLEQEEVESEAE